MVSRNEHSTLLILGIVAALLTVSTACNRGSSGHPVRKANEKVFVMGFDGMDPTLVRRFMDEGKLPNLKKLADGGTFAKLETTQPSESPVAWASFATGVNPGKHNIFDFLVRSLETYMPDLGGVGKEPPRFFWGIPTKAPRIWSTRGGTSFWVHAGADGIKSTVLTVPMTFPPEEIEHGHLLSGLPAPDIRGTIGTFNYWASDLSSFEEGNTEFSGYLKRLLFENGVARSFVRGPESPILRQEEAELREKQKGGKLSDKETSRLEELATTKDITIPVDVKWSEGTGQAQIDIQGTQVVLKPGEWSDWVPLTFSANWLVKMRTMMQFYLVRSDSEVQIYGSPVNLDPRNPPLPISKPNGFSKELADQVGLYRTVGWAEATWPLNEGRIDEATFMNDAERAFREREKLIFNRLEKDDWDLFVAVIETTDRVSHMMFRLIDPKHPMYDADQAAKYGDSIEKVYRWADDLVGRIQAKLPEGTTLFVMSDHGFHSFRRGVNLNTWLAQHGYLAFEGQESGEKKTLADLFGHGKFWEGVDWTRTKAYAVGLGQIYFNLKGRESQGTVSSGAEYRALQEEVASKLHPLLDPESNEPVFGAVYRRDDIYKGDYIQNAPDLQVGFNDGYRVGWQDSLGQIQREVVENNNRKWSGDHCATVSEISGGVLFTNRKLNTATPHIMDLASTILKRLGSPAPADTDGKPIL
jgi:predicted AlkP superfamily phosphohydrolase/phosphomutase